MFFYCKTVIVNSIEVALTTCKKEKDQLALAKTYI